ncbi:TetR/AcrR family transcriptional regulator [Paenibacillus albiflavus]|uniref:TetR/AcrR family transcriptional regulator n=1 Tax=Paenibacillus albiflavus TaxID=2545760 RepID=A0A4R4EMN8_9BACL|nr:TetR/AcrR family transcriptional regulator [Paenibacillus albiflavus]TCZ81117.1 TetR/AcrR family transcriptional regulator [Paenibacillus albiflavus]
MKERILEIALKEIQYKGFRFTMNDLARQAGISTKTLYVMYTSKVEIIDQLLDQAMDEIRIREEAIIADPNQKLMDKIRQLLILVPSDFQFFHMNRLYELQRYYPEQWQRLDQFVNVQWDGVRQLLQEGIASRKLKSFPIDLFIEMYIGGLYRLLEQSAKQEFHMTLEDALEAMIDIMLGGIMNREGE